MRLRRRLDLEWEDCAPSASPSADFSPWPSAAPSTSPLADFSSWVDAPSAARGGGGGGGGGFRGMSLLPLAADALLCGCCRWRRSPSADRWLLFHAAMITGAFNHEAWACSAVTSNPFCTAWTKSSTKEMMRTSLAAYLTEVPRMLSTALRFFKSPCCSKKSL